VSRGCGCTVTIVALATIVTVSSVFAQTPSADPPFVLQSSNGDNVLQFHLLAQLDGRFEVGDDQGLLTDTFLIRRARPILQGRVLRHFEFYFNPDFGLGNAVVQDAYFDTVFSNAFRLRFGKFKAPLGLERLMVAGSLPFAERALPTELVPSRDIGVQILGDLAGNRLTYMAAIENGVVDGGSADLDLNGNKEVAGRVIVRPFASRASSVLSGLGIGIGGSTGVTRDLPLLRTASLMQPFLSYAGATGDGTRTRVTPQAVYYGKAFSAYAEYVRSGQPIRRGDVRADIDHTAWQAAGTFVLTGEPVTERAVRPRNNFDFGGGHMGAIQVTARYHVLEVDEDAISLGLALAGSSHKAEAMTFGVNWYLNPYVKYVCNVERTVFDDDADGPRSPENAVIFRAQLSF
jgi:phosphate-selective porin OprO/OprP